MKFKGSKKGFALIETIVVAAILVATFAIVGVPAVDTSRSLSQTEADSIARQMYVVAQDCLSQYVQSKNYKTVPLRDEAKNIATVTFAPDASNPDDVLTVVGIKNPARKLGSVINSINDIFPSNKMNSDYTQNEWIVEYDPVSMRVTSVFYGATQSGNYEFYSDTYRDRLRESSATRISLAKELGYNVGYYGTNQYIVDMPITNNDPKGRCGASIGVNNGKDLTLTYSFTAPENYKNDTLVVELTFVGSESKETKTIKFELGGLAPGAKIPGTNLVFVGGNGSSDNPYVVIQYVDMEDDSVQFSDEGNFDKFYAGEDITVTAVATVKGQAGTSSDPAKQKFNSLFGSVNKDNNGDDVAEINNKRQLQNLNKLNDKITIEKVEQTDDIDLGGDPFEPIDCPELISYNGNGKEIKNLKVEGSKDPSDDDHNAGLFRNFGKDDKKSNGEKSEIINLTLVDPNVTAYLDGNAGALIGRARDNVTVSGCAIVMGENTQIKAAGAGNLIPEDGNAGSLIGRTGDNTVISGCQAYLKGNYDGKDPASNVHVWSVSGNAGGLIGLAGENLQIGWSSASTVVKGLTYAGGLVGRAGDNASFRYSYADCYITAATVGGIAGLADESTIYNCYAAGFTFENKNILTSYGLIGGDVKDATLVYTVFEVAGLNTYSTFASAGKLSFVKYLDTIDSKHQMGDAIESKLLSDADKTTSAAVLYKGYFIILDDENSYPYNFSSLGLDSYPYPVIEGLTHYGDWTPVTRDLSKVGVCGVFYWEIEKFSESSWKYNFYMVDNEGNPFIDTLCKNHDDGGVITDYGYGVAVRKSNYSTKSIVWDELSVKVPSTQQTGVVTAFKTALENAQKDKKLDVKQYEVFAYKTANSKLNDVSKSSDMYLINPLKEEIGRGLITKTFQYLNQRTYTTVAIYPEGFKEPYFFSFCPYFAADQIVGDGIDYLHNNYYNTYNDINPKSHQIRSIEQLQYLNWNSETYNCQTKSTIHTYAQFPFLNTIGLVSEYVSFDTSSYKQTHDIDGTSFINGTNGFTPIAALGTIGFNTKSWNIEKELFSELQDNLNLKSDLVIYNWFGGEYDGQTYQIKNVSINSDAYTVGLFGSTIGARLHNVLMTSDKGSTIKKSSSNVFMSDYFVGGLVGLACDCNASLLTDVAYYGGVIAEKHSSKDITAKWTGYMDSAINNCAIGGYNIVDQTNHATTVYGGSAVGGLVGASSVRIQNCEAVVDIKIDASSSYGITVVGGLVGSACGGYIDSRVIKSVSVLEQMTEVFAESLSAENNKVLNGLISAYQTIQKDASVKNCYTGGKIEVTNNAIRNLYNAGSKKFKGYYVGGVVGSNNNVGVYNVFNWNDEVNHGLWNHSIAIIDCYTYMDLPAASASDNIYSIGRIFATSANPWWTGVTQDGYDTVNCIINCYYYDQSGSCNCDNFIEKETYFSKTVKQTPYKDIVCTYGTTTLGMGPGVKACSYNYMFLEKTDSDPVLTYNCVNGNSSIIAATPKNLTNNLTYAFNSVIRGTGDRSLIHVGSWPQATRLVMRPGYASGNNMVFYIDNGESVSQLQTHLKHKLVNGNLNAAHGIKETYYNFGYYPVGSLIQVVRGDGTINTNNYYVTSEGKWQRSTATLYVDAKLGYNVTLHMTRPEVKNTVVAAVLQSDGSIKLQNYSAPTRTATGTMKSIALSGWYGEGSTEIKIKADGTFNKNVPVAVASDGTFTVYAGWSISYGEVYKLVSKFTTGKDYLIVNGATPGKSYKLLTVGSSLQYGTRPLNIYKHDDAYYDAKEEASPNILGAKDAAGNWAFYIPSTEDLNNKDWTYLADGSLRYGSDLYLSKWNKDYSGWGDGYLKASYKTRIMKNIQFQIGQNGGIITDGNAYLTLDNTYGYDLAYESNNKYIVGVYLYERTPNLSINEYDFDN